MHEGSPIVLMELLEGETRHWLANAIDLGVVNHRFFSTIDPFHAPVREDSRFQALMDRAREKQRAFEI